jgi:PTS system cellobiose-specific IIB component
MLVVRLFCAAGMSTSLIVRRMEASAAERGLELDVRAYTISEASQHASEAQVVLVGPQVRYRLKDIQQLCDPLGIPVAVIPMRLYGLMDGGAILDLALETMGA